VEKECLMGENSKSEVRERERERRKIRSRTWMGRKSLRGGGEERITTPNRLVSLS
jgi:hypothetical protein